MSLSCVASQLTMRCTITRNKAADDDWNGEGIFDGDIIAASEPCYIYVRNKDHIVNDAQVNVLAKHVALFRASCDLKTNDQIGDIENRRGVVVLAGTFHVETVTPKTVGGSVDHLELTLREVEQIEAGE